MKTLVCDTETNGLRGYTEMWCAVTYCIETQELKLFDKKDPDYVSRFRDYIVDCDHWIMHNGISFDRHVIAHFTGLPLIPLRKITDTLVASRLYNSGREGGHSLDRWGRYFGVEKIKYDGWERYDPMIPERCKVDVFITNKVWEHLRKEGANVSKNAYDLEAQFVEVCDEITDTGFPIRHELLLQKQSALAARHLDLGNTIRDAFPPRAASLAEVNPRVTKSGEFSKNTKGFKQLGEASRLVWGEFTLLEWKEFNPRSAPQVRERMDEYGWKPTVFTKPSKSFPEGQPKVCPENLETLDANAPPAAQSLKEYLVLSSMLDDVNNWVENYNEETGRIHGDIFHIGAITHRCAHRNPNTANVSGDETWALRECWGVDPDSDYRLVGVDAKGVQLRVLAHLTDSEEFRKVVLTGDPHMEFTQPIVAKFFPEAVAYTTPEEAHEVKQKKTKRFIYAWLLGAGFKKIGLIFGLGQSEGKIISEGFTNEFPGLPELKGYLGECAKRGWYPAPDGRYIPIKSEHYSLSVALQGIEAILMKLAIILWTRERNKRKLDAKIVAFVHDECQLLCHHTVAEEAGQMFMDCIEEAGKMLRLRCPMGGDMNIGYNWMETH